MTFNVLEESPQTLVIIPQTEDAEVLAQAPDLSSLLLVPPELCEDAVFCAHLPRLTAPPKHTLAAQELREEGQNKMLRKIHQNMGPLAPFLRLLGHFVFLGTDCVSGLT